MWQGRHKVGKWSLFSISSAFFGLKSAHLYDESHFGAYMLENLHEKRSKIPEKSTNWLQKDPPKFPFVLGLSSSDTPSIVLKSILSDTQAIGEEDDAFVKTLQDLSTPQHPIQQFIHTLANTYRFFDSTMTRLLSEPVYHPNQLQQSQHQQQSSSSCEMSSYLSITLEALESLAVRLEEEQPQNVHHHHHLHKEEEDNTVEQDQQPSGGPPLVFVVNDFDQMILKEQHKLIQWTTQVTSKGLGHIVLVTSKPLTPQRIQELSTLSDMDTNNNDTVDGGFVAILLRPGTNIVDKTTASEKILRLYEKYLPSLEPLEEETLLIELTCGNWWTDLDQVIQRFGHEITTTQVSTRSMSKEERLASLHQVIDTYKKQVKQVVRQQFKGLLLVDEEEDTTSVHQLSTDDILDTIDTWYCFQLICELGMGMDSQNNDQLLNVQSFLTKASTSTQQEHQENILPLVQVLGCFNVERPQSEMKFFELISQEMLHFFYAQEMSTNVLPCSKIDLFDRDCFIQIRPLVKSLFTEEIWKNPMNFHKIQHFEKQLYQHQLRQEIQVYKKDLNLLKQKFIQEKKNFQLKYDDYDKKTTSCRSSSSSSMFSYLFSRTCTNTSTINNSTIDKEEKERITCEAELSLMKIQIQAKEQYLRKLKQIAQEIF